MKTQKRNGLLGPARGTLIITLCIQVACLWSAGCATPELPPEISPPVAKVNTPVPRTVNLSLENLNRVAPPETHKGELVQDIRWYLRAQLRAEQGDTNAAAAAFKQALGHSRGVFSKAIFESWLNAYVAQLSEKVSEEILARLVLAELDETHRPAYFNRAGLADENTLKVELRRLVPGALVQPIPVNVARSEPNVDPKFLAKNLEAITTAVAESCGNQNDNFGRVDSKSFTAALLQFWQAAIHQCEGHLNLAAEAFDKLLARRQKNELGLGHYWYASQQRINALRGIGKRQEASDEYLRLIKIWEQKELSPGTLGMETDEFSLQKINAALWAARYRALTGDLEGAKGLAMKALNWVNKTYLSVNLHNRQQLIEYKAEAYHVLSSRIALEQRKFDEAITYATLGYEISEVGTEWQDRFAWSLGLYHYLIGNPHAALRHWEALFSSTRNEDLKPQLYFWLAKLHYDAEQIQEGDFYFHALTDEYPLNYYAVVAPELANFPEPERWKNAFEPTTKLNQGLMLLDRFQLDSMRHDPAVADLLLRAEIVVAAGLDDEITHTCVEELSRTMRSNYRMADKAYPLYVYLSRLQYAANQYVQAISLTSLLRGGSRSFWTDWPDQVTVYFPQPYADVFSASSDASGVPVETLLGVSRQETSFRPKAKSGAGAIGMMQLIPVTARRMAKEVGLDEFGIEAKLTDPRVNTVLGAAYLKFLERYYKGFKPAVYAAYNAGEYAVDQWLERRQHSTVLGFIELIPFSETKGYVRNVMRNVKVYQFLSQSSETWTYQRPKLDPWFLHLLHM